jgi:hypothetical protein
MRKLNDGFCCGCLSMGPLTQDHIIPQAIGGKLKVSICVACHTKIHPIDTELTKHLHQIATLLNIKRERKENKPFRVKQVSTGDEFDIDSNTGYRARPQVKIKYDIKGYPIPDVRAGSRKKVLEILKGIEKKHGQFSQEVAIIKDPIPLGMVEYENMVGGRLFMRSVAKTAYLLLVSRLPDANVSSKVFDPTRNFIFEDQGQSLTSFNFVHTKFMNRSRRPLHGIAIHYDSRGRNIVGYVQYFGIFRFSVLLAQGVPWKITIADIKYSVNPVTGYEIPFKPDFILPDVMTEECLHPVQTTQLVHTEIANGLKSLRSYCHSIGEPEIEFVDSQNTKKGTVLFY